MISELVRFKFSDQEHFLKAISIRKKVFVDEQGVDKNLEFNPDQDKIAHHYILYIDGIPVATGRWRETTEGIKAERFAVLKSQRNKGLGKIVLDEILKDITPLGKKIYIHAQIGAVNFYKRNGFVLMGEKFTEAGIDHYKMEYRQTGQDFPMTTDY
jgi:predicted GNAT family N-acyltransferase